jgi:predicted ATPase/DNA-binding SARP family transcriptional activator/DNA-binding CsgD family transcriptional regulator
MGSSGSKRVISPETPMGEKRKAVRVWLLGGFRVSVGSRTISQDSWRLRKAAALVKLLALTPSHRLHREQAMDLLWPDLGRRAASNNLRQALHAARSVLDPAMGARYLASEDESLVLCPKDDLWVDVDAFEAAAATARGLREVATYRAALDLYEGDLLPEERYEEWTEGRRNELRQLYLALLVELAGLYEVRREHESAIELVRKATAEQPTLEEAHVALMRLYALSGRPERALAQYERLRDSLSIGLGTLPAAFSSRLRDEIATGEFPPPQPSPSAPPREESLETAKHNLPVPRTSFVGRERELIEVKRLLAMTRLLTLTGAGGSGKTRLALEVARDLAGLYPDGVWLVELAALTQGALVPQVVAEILGVQEQPNRPLTVTLAEALRAKKMLIVLDNCEHVVEACARLTDVLLRSCSEVRVLASSRESLNVAGEVVWSVPPLSVPDAERLPNLECRRVYESTRLFVERALRRTSAFVLTADTASAAAEICQQLEGMPLAIELAAAWVGTLAVGQISERLGDSLKLLTGGERTAMPRQQTLRGTLDWSYDLLSEEEKRLFCQLSAFAGGWTLEAAEAVGACGEGEPVLDLLGRLVGKSLVVVEVAQDGSVRYTLLEPVRQYAREKLEESGEAEVVLRRHAEFFLALAERAEPELKGARQEEWLGRLEEEHDNFRAALSWAMDRCEAELALRLGAALGDFWHMRGHLGEGQRWLEGALAIGDAASVERVKALAKASWIAWEQTDLERATALGEEGLKLARTLGDEKGVAAALLNLGIAVMVRGELERATTLIEEGLPKFHELRDKWGLARSLLCLGLVAMFRGDYEQAKESTEEGLAVSQKSGDVWCSNMALNQMALMALLREDFGRAGALCKESLELSRRSGMVHHIAFALHTAAALASSQDQPVRSARLWGAAEVLREAIGTAFSPMEQRVYEPYMAAACDQVEDARWETAWSEGRAMGMDEAIEYALSEEEGIPSTAPAPRQRVAEEAALLTRREEEVAALVARGLTNRHIATELSISEHTVANHVARILRKLGLDSRSQLTAWVVEQRTSP